MYLLQSLTLATALLLGAPIWILGVMCCSPAGIFRAPKVSL
jgi:hypothetical protein